MLRPPIVLNGITEIVAWNLLIRIYMFIQPLFDAIRMAECKCFVTLKIIQIFSRLKLLHEFCSFSFRQLPFCHRGLQHYRDIFVFWDKGRTHNERTCFAFKRYWTKKKRILFSHFLKKKTCFGNRIFQRKMKTKFIFSSVLLPREYAIRFDFNSHFWSKHTNTVALNSG